MTTSQSIHFQETSEICSVSIKDGGEVGVTMVWGGEWIIPHTDILVGVTGLEDSKGVSGASVYEYFLGQ